jgi:hypothetical protein
MVHDENACRDPQAGKKFPVLVIASPEAIDQRAQMVLGRSTMGGSSRSASPCNNFKRRPFQSAFTLPGNRTSMIKMQKKNVDNCV